jgi:membrane protease YdiL (CAAX protease family)
LPNAVEAKLAQGRSVQAQAGGHTSAAAEHAEAKDAVFAALTQPQDGTAAARRLGATRGGCCMDRSKLGGPEQRRGGYALAITHCPTRCYAKAQPTNRETVYFGLMTTDHDLPPQQLALMGVICEGGLALIAMGLGRWLGHPPQRAITWGLSGFGYGLLGSLPLLGFFWLCLRFPHGPLAELVEVVDRYLVPLFRPLMVWEVAVIAVLAGLGEEMLFRGVFQEEFAGWVKGPQGVIFGLLLASLLFGLLHFITPSYALFAGLTGLYLGGLCLLTRNLLVPITTHGVYDFLALVYLTRIRRSVTVHKSA